MLQRREEWDKVTFFVAGRYYDRDARRALILRVCGYCSATVHTAHSDNSDRGTRGGDDSGDQFSPLRME
jgi:hypothetical protein